MEKEKERNKEKKCLELRTESEKVGQNKTETVISKPIMEQTDKYSTSIIFSLRSKNKKQQQQLQQQQQQQQLQQQQHQHAKKTTFLCPPCFPLTLIFSSAWS